VAGWAAASVSEDASQVVPCARPKQRAKARAEPSPPLEPDDETDLDRLLAGTLLEAPKAQSRSKAAAKPTQRFQPTKERETELDRLCASSPDKAGLPSTRPKQRAKPPAVPRQEDTDTEPPSDADDATEPPSDDDAKKADVEAEPTSMVDTEGDTEASEPEPAQVPSARPKVRARPMKSAEELYAEKQLEAIYRQASKLDNGRHSPQKETTPADDSDSGDKESLRDSPVRFSPQAGRSKARARPPNRSEARSRDAKRPKLEEVPPDHIPCARPKVRARIHQEYPFS